MGLDYTWNLKKALVEKKMDKDLKYVIQTYIEKQEHWLRENGVSRGSFVRLTFRNNLSYIIDNIRKPGLIDELRKLI